MFYGLKNSNILIKIHFMDNYKLLHVVHVRHFSTKAKNIAIFKVARISFFFEKIPYD
jgi:hypothetical protein